MKDVMAPVPPEEVRAVIKQCLSKSALVNYTRISNDVKLEGIKLLLLDLKICYKNDFSSKNKFHKIFIRKNGY